LRRITFKIGRGLFLCYANSASKASGYQIEKTLVGIKGDARSTVSYYG
jgi:hypothetical protein